MQGGTEVTSEEILAEYKKNISFYSRGGITVTGGEPLMQTPFVTALFRRLRDLGISTALDTSGYRLDARVKALL
jgi:pyruvate formate lyase activating enzyme